MGWSTLPVHKSTSPRNICIFSFKSPYCNTVLYRHQGSLFDVFICPNCAIGNCKTENIKCITYPTARRAERVDCCKCGVIEGRPPTTSSKIVYS